MIKIEKLNTAKAVFLRDGVEQPVFLHALLTPKEYKTLKVLEGSLVVSIDEQEVVTVSATSEAEVPKAVAQVEETPAPAEEPKSEEQSEPAVEAPAAPAIKTIVQPKARTAK